MENNNYSTQLLRRCLAAKQLYGLSVTKIAEQAGMAKSTVHNQLNGRYKLDVDVVGAIAELCQGLSAEWLLRGTGTSTITTTDLADIVRRIEALEGGVQ